MSARLDLPHGLSVIDTLAVLAPKFRDAVAAAIADCHAEGLDAVVYETFRTNELQALYYARGRTVKPPNYTVTNAPDNRSSWHGYGLAVDVISALRRWDAGDAWFRQVADVFKRHGCDWGGDWTHPDLPHFQWGRCKPSPSDEARRLLAAGGLDAVWQAVGAA